MILEKLNQPKAAMTAYREALKIDADAAQPLGALVRLNLEAGDRDEALRYLRRFTAVVGDDVTDLVKAAEWHLRLDRLEDAFDLATQAREQRFHEKAQRVLGLVYLRRGDLAKAVFHLDRAEADADVLQALIPAYLALGKLREAEERVEKARTLTTDLPSELRQAMNQVAALTQRRADLLARVPDRERKEGLLPTISCYVCAEHAFAMGLPAEKVETLLAGTFKEGIELGPAYALRGLLSLGRGRLTFALADAERSLALDPQDARACYVRGRIRLERGDTAGALADLNRAAELSERQDATILHWLAAALDRSDRHFDALTTQRQAVRLNPNDPEMAEQLKEMEKAEESKRGSR
jgi:tetratricopeptide (TPR) repeat protein